MATPKKRGAQTVQFQNPPVILAAAAVAGPKEAEGPLGKTFDRVSGEPYYGQKTWEKAEQRMLQYAMEIALKKAGIRAADMEFLLAGDLLNQIIAANFTARSLAVPFFGLYGACSTLYEALTIGAMLIDGGFAEHVLVGASSHYGTAERQFRFPTELGGQRPMTAQWTVTGAGAVVLSRAGLKRFIGIGTGALFSPCSYQQGETVPGIGHAVVIEAGKAVRN